MRAINFPVQSPCEFLRSLVGQPGELLPACRYVIRAITITGRVRYISHESKPITDPRAAGVFEGIEEARQQCEIIRAWGRRYSIDSFLSATVVVLLPVTLN